MDNKILFFYQNQKGYIALIALLIVATIGLSISLSVSFRNIENLQMGFATEQANQAYNLANSCLEEGLNQLRNNWNNYSQTLLIDGYSCIINAEVLGDLANLNAVGIINNYYQQIQVEIDSNLNILSWN